MSQLDTPRLPPAGWYADPIGRYRLRFWDGNRWTPGVSDGRTVREEQLPAPDPDLRMRLPLRAAWLAIGGLFLGVALGGLLGFLSGLASGHRVVVELLVGQAGLWGGWYATCVLASRRWGTGHLRRDYGVVARRHDLWRGLGYSLLFRLVGGVAIGILVAVFQHYFLHAPAADGALGTGTADRAALIALAAIAAVGAPLIEELFFRGLLMGSLARLGPRWAVGIQAVVFALGHLRPEYGRSNYLTFLAIGIAGVGLGWCAQHYRRLGPGMWTHGLFNLLAVVVLLVATFA